MRVRVEYPVSGKGKAKGYRTSKNIMGAMGIDVDIEETQSDLATFITLQYPGSTIQLPYLIDESGQVLKPYQNRLYQSETGPAIIVTLDDARNAPIAKNAVERARKTINDRTDQELKSYFKGERRSILREPLPLLSSDIFRDVELNSAWVSEAEVREDAKELIVKDGQLFKKVPEPFWTVTYTPRQLNPIEIKLMKPDGYYELSRLIGNLSRTHHITTEIAGAFGLNDLDRANAYAEELAKKLNVKCGKPEGPDVVMHDPHRLVGTGYNLYLVAFTMRNAAVQAITESAPHTIESYASRICKWNEETLSLFKRLNAAIAPDIWASNMEELEDVVKDIMRLEGEKPASECIFRSREVGSDVVLADEMWQEWLMMEPVSLPSLSSL